MEELIINVSESEFERLNALYPPTAKSSNVGKRAEELVKYYFRSIDKNYVFEKASKGADINVILNNSSFEIEVKGTAADDLAWNRLKVSGVPSHDRLEKGLPLYRVISVYDRTPTMFILSGEQDFTMELEARWAVKPKNA